MFLYLLLLLGSGNSVPDVDIADATSEEGVEFVDPKLTRYIIPSYYYVDKLYHTEEVKNVNIEFPEFIEKDTERYQNFKKLVLDGKLKKGLTFNIFDYNINAAVQELFDFIQDLNRHEVEFFRDWATKHINREMFDYVLRLNALFSKETIFDAFIPMEPPYLMQPHYYVNSDTLVKALKSKLGMLSEDENYINEIERLENLTIINVSNSTWNLDDNGCDEELRYFREDIGLNSYYYSLHITHPFWMPFEKLDEVNIRHAEFYYHAHQQLMARYFLERQHLNKRARPITLDCKKTLNPYLMYDNGLPFPSTKKIDGKMTTEAMEIKQTDILLKECIARGVIISDNGTLKNVSEMDGMNAIARFVLKHIDSYKIVKRIRDMYDGQFKDIKKYNPAPSILYNYQTVLRDSVYWGALQYAMSYFTEYNSLLPPLDVSLYNEQDIKLGDAGFTTFSTRFEYFEFSLENYFNSLMETPEKKNRIHIRQKRLTYFPLSTSFHVLSNYTFRQVNVKIFLGPECYQKSCWDQYNRFYQLDTFNVKLEKGLNTLNWDPENNMSSKFSYDDEHNKHHNNSLIKRYNFYRFPHNLILPRGSETGLKITLFIIINSLHGKNKTDEPLNLCYYNRLVHDYYDSKPLGFPFHKRAINYEEGTNYKFYNVTIYHNPKVV